MQKPSPPLNVTIHEGSDAERPVVSRLDCTNILKSETCRCGGSKAMNRAFCFHCWNRLPRNIRHRLYNRIGQGFEQAIVEAWAVLDG